MKGRIVPACAALAALIAACSAGAAASPYVAPTSGYNALPIDATVAAVSLSHPSAGAEAALEYCEVAQLGAGQVAAMGQIPHASDLDQFVPVTGLEPLVSSDQPIWVIQFNGDVPQPLENEVWVNPICVYGTGSSDQGWYAVGDVRLPSGAIVTPNPPPIRPSKALPPLQP